MNCMKTGQILHLGLGKWACLGFLLLISGNTKVTAAIEESFDTLQIGTHVYSNVTVTTKTKAYVFILHSAGMTNLKVADLPPEVQQKLGYTAPEEHSSSKASAAWAEKTMATLHVPQVKAMNPQMVQDLRERLLPTNLPLPQFTTGFFVILGSAVVLIHLFFSYCCLLICQKTGAKPGIIVFVPILQMVPLLQAAGMSPWWLLALFVPVLNIVASVIWCFKIAKTRNKTAWVGVFLILPVTNLFAFLYLAFSGAGRTEKARPRVPIMTLETA